jgi:hypothetical protein
MKGERSKVKGQRLKDRRWAVGKVRRWDEGRAFGRWRVEAIRKEGETVRG